jgi:hypothetical protein
MTLSAHRMGWLLASGVSIRLGLLYPSHRGSDERIMGDESAVRHGRGTHEKRSNSQLAR